MNFKIKPIHKDAVTHALTKADKYRLLNEPSASESICHDILAVDSGNQKALTMLILTLTDQFGSGVHVTQAKDLIPKLKDEYQRHYYMGVACERWARTQLKQSHPGAGFSAYDWFVEAIQWYEMAEKVHPKGNDDAILRYNTCVRLIQSNKLSEQTEEWHDPYLE